MIQLLVSMLTAHIIADFWLQPNWMVVRKKNPGILMLHAIIHTFLAWAFSLQLTCWIVPVGVFVSHLVLDAAKIPFKDNVRNFILDQILHVFSLVGVAFLADHYASFPLPAVAPFLLRAEVWIGGLVLAVYGSGVLVGKIIDGLLADNSGLEDLIKGEGLTHGGKTIGKLERALIFLLVMVGQPAGIGFLVAAKSVLRFGEARDNKKLAEYVLIGTLLSFGLAIAIAALTKWVLVKEASYPYGL